MKMALDIRIIGDETEVKDFVALCKVIQKIGRVGYSKNITLHVDGGDKLDFFRIESGGMEEDRDSLMYIEFNSDKVDINKIDKISIGE